MDDLISRHAAIDALMAAIDAVGILDGDDIKVIFDNLLSAQPEIITCNDCVHSDTFPEGADNDMPLKCLDIRYGGVMPDWYCEHAERRTDDKG